MSTNKKQYSFWADADVSKYIDTLDSGLKTKTINDAIRFYRKHHEKLEPLLVERVSLLEQRVSRLEKQ